MWPIQYENLESPLHTVCPQNRNGLSGLPSPEGQRQVVGVSSNSVINLLSPEKTVSGSGVTTGGSVAGGLKGSSLDVITRLDRRSTGGGVGLGAFSLIRPMRCLLPITAFRVNEVKNLALRTVAIAPEEHGPVLR